jgi:dimethylargininase
VADAHSPLYAVVRGVPDTFALGERPTDSAEDVDVGLARIQHEAYCRVLEGAGLSLVYIPADVRFPDCCFVEDTSVIAGRTAIITRMGALPRRGEEAAVREVLANHMPVLDIASPASLDGGDVLVLGDCIFIGLGGRTNRAAVDQVRDMVGPAFSVTAVPLEGVLHLKSACTRVDGGHLLIRRGHFDESVFEGYNLIDVPEEEAYAANCLGLGRVVLVSAGFPETRQAVESAGFEAVEMETSEFRKMQGSLTCLSKIF